MQLSSFKKQTVGKGHTYIDSDSVVLFFPSSTVPIWNGIYESGFLLSNCQGLVAPNKVVRYFRQPINGRIHFLELRKRLVEMQGVERKIKVLASIPTVNGNKKEKKQFFFYDLSLLLKGVEYGLKKEFPIRKIAGAIFDELDQLYHTIKRDHPEKHIHLMFHVDNQEDFTYKFLSDYRRVKRLLGKDYNGHKFFDSFGFVSAKGRVFPILENLEETGAELILPRMRYMTVLVQTGEEIENLDDPAISKMDVKQSEKEPEAMPQSLATDIVSHLTEPLKVFKKELDVKGAIQKSMVKSLSNPDGPSSTELPTELPPEVQDAAQNLVGKPDLKKPLLSAPLKVTAKLNSDDNVDIGIDNRALTRVLRAYQVTNTEIVINIKSALEKYIKEMGVTPSKLKAEELVLKAVHYTIHGTDEIQDVYKENPALLFNKLGQMDIFSKTLTIPDLGSLPFVPKDLINIDKTTGQHRQAYEFGEVMNENIEKVFNVLESQPNHPIKVKKITSEVIDTETDRYREYTITLQNMTGNKETYPVQIRIPTTVNDKYFKLGGTQYIFSSQQHLKPLTKTNKNDVRFLSNYAIIRLCVENMRFNVSDIKDIVLYVQQRYPNLIQDIDSERVLFTDGSSIWLVGNQVYKADAVKTTDLEDENYRPINRPLFMRELELNASRKDEKLNDNTSTSDLAWTEQYLGIKLPDDVRSLVLSTPNGYELDGFEGLRFGDLSGDDSVKGLTEKHRDDFFNKVILFRDENFFYCFDPETNTLSSVLRKNKAEQERFTTVDDMLNTALSGRAGFKGKHPEYSNLEVEIDPETNKLVDKTSGTEFKSNRFEFLFDIILSKIQTVNPQDGLTRTKKSIPYISLYLSGTKIPLIIYMWQQKGLLSALNTFGINYEIMPERGAKGDIFIELEGGKYLSVMPSNIKERLVANGLLVNKIKYPINKLDDPLEIEKHINDTYGPRAIFNLKNMTANMIDPITKELLEFDNIPTNLPGIVSGPALNKLLNDPVDSLADLNIYRTRMGEIIVRLMYKQLLRAHGSYFHRVEFGDKKAKLMLVPDFVMNEFLGKNPPENTIERTAGANLELSASVNPIDEIMLSSKVVKTGAGGLSSKNEFKPSHRNIHESQNGIMSALATPESATVGIIAHHTLTPLIINKYGSYGHKDTSGLDGFNTVGASEALIPLVQEIYSDRGTLVVQVS